MSSKVPAPPSPSQRGAEGAASPPVTRSRSRERRGLLLPSQHSHFTLRASGGEDRGRGQTQILTGEIRIFLFSPEELRVNLDNGRRSRRRRGDSVPANGESCPAGGGVTCVDAGARPPASVSVFLAQIFGCSFRSKPSFCL